MISTVILTKNEEKNIAKCLESVKWCDEIVIIDDKSTDKTIEIAKKYKAAVYANNLKGDFSAQRNFGLSKVKNEWVLFVDSDEIISDALAYELSNAIGLKDQNLRNFNGFYLKRSDFMWGKQLKYGETGNIRLLRLGKKGSGDWTGKAHEKWQIDGPTGKLVNPILHFPHKTLEEFLREINFYTDIRAEELKDKRTKISFWLILLYPAGKFIINYFFKKGFMDGMQGLVFAIIMSFHSFLVRSKLWLMKNEK
ncbi:MAG: glycosyltransferase family 2 protein [Candidatus Parcubacteria bacterium]|nr:glycosyltransferase family 2 protein [Candidatus Parcubacteria bacterium]